MMKVQVKLSYFPRQYDHLPREERVKHFRDIVFEMDEEEAQKLSNIRGTVVFGVEWKKPDGSRIVVM